MEEFLLTTEHNEVNAVIINSLFHDNCYVREHMADMVGEKKLLAGLSSLLAQLNREENIYATSSIITALGKLGDKKAYGYILKWFKKNEARIMGTEHFFILKHIYVALASIDGKNQKTTDFIKKYEQHISPEFMS
jgi:HEAT repeat protein